MVARQDMGKPACAPQIRGPLSQVALIGAAAVQADIHGHAARKPRAFARRLLAQEVFGILVGIERFIDRANGQIG